MSIFDENKFYSDLKGEKWEILSRIAWDWDESKSILNKKTLHSAQENTPITLNVFLKRYMNEVEGALDGKYLCKACNHDLGKIALLYSVIQYSFKIKKSDQNNVIVWENIVKHIEKVITKNGYKFVNKKNNIYEIRKCDSDDFTIIEEETNKNINIDKIYIKFNNDLSEILNNFDWDKDQKYSILDDETLHLPKQKSKISINIILDEYAKNIMDVLDGNYLHDFCKKDKVEETELLYNVIFYFYKNKKENWKKPEDWEKVLKNINEVIMKNGYKFTNIEENKYKLIKI